jgi:hypothetical protein
VDLWERAANSGFEVLCIPAHTSGVLQPLDLCTNVLFKTCLTKANGYSKKKFDEHKPYFFR